MTKLRKTMMMLVFTLAVVLGITAGTGNAKAATTKNFKGNLNVAYKNSNSKITIKKINSKKVSIRIVYDGYAKFKYTGKITSKNTIKFNAVNNEDGYADVIFKWKDKSHFTSIWKEKRSNSLKYCSDELGFALYDTKYTQVKKSSTAYYYGAFRANGEEGEFYSDKPLFEKAIIKGNELIITGTLMGSKDRNKAFYKGKFYDYKKRTFKLTNNTKYYQMASEWNPEGKEKFKKSKKYAIKWCKLCYGICIKVVNNKVEWIELSD